MRGHENFASTILSCKTKINGVSTKIKCEHKMYCIYTNHTRQTGAEHHNTQQNNTKSTTEKREASEKEKDRSSRE